MMNHQPPPNWVLGRAECNLSMTFESLHEIAKRDVEAFNGLYERYRQGRTFKVVDNTEGCLPKFQVEQEADIENPPCVLFTLSRTAIRVNGGGVQFFIRPQWDGEKCRMHVNDEQDAHELWEISQRALSNLFFPA